MNEFLNRKELGDSKLLKQLGVQMEKAVAGRILTGELLSKHTSWRVGGPATFYAYPADIAALVALIEFCREQKLQKFVVGYGTNLLVSDEGYPGCIIDLAEGAGDLKIEGDTMRVGCGVWLGEAIRIAAEQGLGGMEKLAGIPGGVGGALAMNAGAFGMSISDHLIEVDLVTAEGKRETFAKERIDFGYRTAPGIIGTAMFGARFALPRKKKWQVIKEIEDTISERFRRHVMTLPSAGSVFKNPPGGFAAKMVEAVGGKGLSEGGVEISRLHANFIVNARGGTAADIIRLVRRVRKLVMDQFGASLDLEVKTLGFEGDALDSVEPARSVGA